MKILIIDDEKISRLRMVKSLNPQFLIFEAGSFEEAQKKLSEQSFDICFIDLNLDSSLELKGLELVPISRGQGAYTVVMTSIDDDGVLELAYEKGAQDVYLKGSEVENVQDVINQYLQIKDFFTEDYFFTEVIKTKNNQYKESLKKLIKVIPTDISLCLLGESGTGKSYLARSIHELAKVEGPFVEINCASLTGDTLKAELFGHTKGAFTGASSDYKGKLALADKGTLFLDEIGSMSQETQELLLKAIEEKSFYPLGSNKIVKSNFRLITATLDDLEERVRNKEFRFDLYQRIMGHTFKQFSLRERKEDIFDLINLKMGQNRKIIIKEDAKKILESYSWPGNLRELFKLCDHLKQTRACILKKEDLGDLIEKKTNSENRLLISSQFELAKELGLKEFIEKISSEIVQKSYEENKQKATKAISDLKISNGTFYKYLKSGSYELSN